MMVSLTRIVITLLLFAAPVVAQEATKPESLPDKPVPRGNFITRPFHDRHVAILAAISAGAATWDDIATRKVIERGGYERNPLVRPFMHNSGVLAVETIGEVWIVAFITDRMKHSQHSLLRKTWWLPQALDISGKLYGGINSTTILGR